MKLTRNADTWLKKAADKKNVREMLRTVHGNIAEDGFRLHRDCTLEYCGTDEDRGRFDLILDSVKKNNNLALVQRDALLRSCALYIAIGRGYRPKDDIAPTMKLSVNGRLDYSAKTDDNATDGWMTIQHTGEDITLGIDPEYLYDALSGMSEEVYLSFHKPTSPVLLTDGKREAVIMPKRLE